MSTKKVKLKEPEPKYCKLRMFKLLHTLLMKNKFYLPQLEIPESMVYGFGFPKPVNFTTNDRQLASKVSNDLDAFTRFISHYVARNGKLTDAGIMKTIQGNKPLRSVDAMSIWRNYVQYGKKFVL